ncbi:MAG: endonuclease [candidate division WOR-3 bacterium]
MVSEEKVEWVFLKLLCKFGRQKWWPRIWKDGDFLDEIIIGAILTQNVSWKNVEKALMNLERRGIKSIEKLVKLKDEEAYRVLKPAAFVKRKIRTLREVYKVVQNKKPKREDLLNVYGIGEETADVILLYAYNEPVFIVDEYTKRWFERFFGLRVDNKTLKRHLHISDDLFYLREMHALLDELGKRYCKKRPLCEACPLRGKCGYIQSQPYNT